jgi:uncharacterized membrane protein YeaQ/YmgE (transglycosylase-associated protein family)
MSFLAWIVFGFFVGLIARAIMPGSQKMGFIKTILLGVIGSFVGGTIANLMSNGTMSGQIVASDFLGSLLGAILVLFIAGRLSSR